MNERHPGMYESISLDLAATIIYMKVQGERKTFSRHKTRSRLHNFLFVVRAPNVFRINSTQHKERKKSNKRKATTKSKRYSANSLHRSHCWRHEFAVIVTNRKYIG
jgi:hypothetical protein